MGQKATSELKGFGKSQRTFCFFKNKLSWLCNKKKVFCKIFLCVILFNFFAVCFVGCKKDNIKNVSKDLTNYTINAEFIDLDSKILHCTQTVDYVNPYETTLNKLQFHLYPNAFGESVKKGPVSTSYTAKAYPNGEDYGEIVVESVKVGDQLQDVEVGNSYNETLFVDLQGELYPDERVNIEFEYNVVLPNCLHRFGYGDNTYNFGNFYPIVAIYENGEFQFDEYGSNGDPFYSDVANYEVKIVCDEDFVVASTGEQTSNQINLEHKREVLISAQAVRDFAFVMSKKFEVISGKAGDTTVFYYYYDEENPQDSLKAGIDAINTFGDLFGTYPYSTMSVAKTNFIHGGMEYPNLVFISDAIDSKTEYLNVIVHEVAHQWWYSLVGNNECEYAWLDEGLTEYSTLMFYNYNTGYNVDTKESLKNSLSSYLLFSEICTSVYGNFEGVMNKNVNEYKGDMEYVYVTYVKGVLFFDNLCETVGTKNFLKSLKLYFKENCYKNATPNNLIACFNKCCKRDLTNFFESWTEGKVVLQNYK